MDYSSGLQKSLFMLWINYLTLHMCRPLVPEIKTLGKVYEFLWSGPDRKAETELRHRGDTRLLLLPAARMSTKLTCSDYVLPVHNIHLSGDLAEDDLQDYCLCRL